jgi:hypothetical protein
VFSGKERKKNFAPRGRAETIEKNHKNPDSTCKNNKIHRLPIRKMLASESALIHYQEKTF